jgi:hypothetical protein
MALVLAAVAAGAGGVASAAEPATMTLGSAGIRPLTITIPWGSSITFTNVDSETHTIEIPRVPFTSSPLPQGASVNYTFDGRAGNYTIRQLGQRTFTARVLVELSGTVTLDEPPAPVPFGRQLALRGTTTLVDHPVAIEIRRPGESDWAPFTEATPTPDGGFVALVTPEADARYRATAAAGQLRSPAVRALVEPAVTLRILSRNPRVGARVVLTARVRPGAAARRVVVEAYDPSRKRWVTLASPRLRSAGTVRFSLPVRAAGRFRLRAVVPRRYVAPGFAEATSPSIVLVAGS